jgi:hypothetical protein
MMKPKTIKNSVQKRSIYFNCRALILNGNKDSRIAYLDIRSPVESRLVNILFVIRLSAEEYFSFPQQIP